MEVEGRRQLDGVISPQHMQIGELRRVPQQGDRDFHDAVMLGEVLAELFSAVPAWAMVRLPKRRRRAIAAVISTSVMRST